MAGLKSQSGAADAIASARAAQPAWAATTPRDRLAVIRRARHRIAESATRLAEAVHTGRGVPSAETLAAEVLPLADACHFLEQEAVRLLKRCTQYAVGANGRRNGARPRFRSARGANARSFHPVRRLGARRFARRLDAAGAACGVETEAGEKISLAAVVSNADAVRTRRELLGGKPAARFERRRRYEPACSGVVLYLGLAQGYDHLLHHNFVFSQNAEEEFEAIYRRGEPAAASCRS
jgi:hypothetical protein